MNDTPSRILAYWFGPLLPDGMCDPQQHGLWFKRSDHTDREIAEHFRSEVDAALAGELDAWAETDEGLVALVILLDQFTRNLFRGTPEAFAGDARALQVVLAAVDSGRHLRLPLIHRVFIYIPFEHSEDLAIQDRGFELFDALVSDGGGDARLVDFRRYMVAHRDVIARFGRFPHRNGILGRESSAEELAHLETHGGF